MISLFHYLMISSFLFIMGTIVIIARKNIIGMLLGIELLLNASGLNFMAYTRFINHNVDGHIMTLFIIVIAAAEAAVALAITIRFFQIKKSIHIDDATILKN